VVVWECVHVCMHILYTHEHARANNKPSYIHALTHTHVRSQMHSIQTYLHSLTRTHTHTYEQTHAFTQAVLAHHSHTYLTSYPSFFKRRLRPSFICARTWRDMLRGLVRRSNTQLAGFLPCRSCESFEFCLPSAQ